MINEGGEQGTVSRQRGLPNIPMEEMHKSIKKVKRIKHRNEQIFKVWE